MSGTKKFKRKSISDNDNFNIREASLKEEQYSEQSAENEIQNLIEAEIQNEFNGEDISKINNLKDTKEISLSDTKNSAKESKRINFMNEEAVNEYTASESKASENKPKDDFANTTTEELQDKIRRDENNSASYSPSELKEFAGFIILMIDTVVANALRWFAKDTSTSAYSLPKGSQDKLEKSLTYILVKYQSKFKVEFMFLVMLVLLYAPKFIDARKRRKDVLDAEANLANKRAAEAKRKAEEDYLKSQQKNNNFEEIKPIQSNDSIDNLKVIIPTVDDDEPIIPKRKRGPARKN